ncbi:MAG: DUF2007 domain-containing protein [Phycisphaeraceae bacterium]|nr:MAG: DUF2007 domain-containing protein [Phycisphaeraceae bacterium]
MTDDRTRLVELCTAVTAFEAETIVNALRAGGVEATVFNAAFQSMMGGVPIGEPVKVMVRACDEAEARAVLATSKEDSIDIDWNEVDVGEMPEDPEEQP